jgi:hypothetical protein
MKKRKFSLCLVIAICIVTSAMVLPGGVTIAASSISAPVKSPIVPPISKQIILDSSKTNIMSVGMIGVVNQSSGLNWTYKIDDSSIINIVPGIPVLLSSSCIVNTNTWRFIALKAGKTKITFIGTPKNPKMGMASQIEVYSISVV